jgi:hypothetical protein
MSDAGLQALISSLRRMRYFEVFEPPDDLLVIAVANVLGMAENDTERALLFRRVVERLDAEDQELLRRRFVR